MRKIKLEIHKYYHVYNRGAHRQDIFLDDQDYFVFLKRIWEFNNESTYEQRKYLKNKQQVEAASKKRPETEASVSGRFLDAASVKNINLALFTSLFDFLSRIPKLVDIICYCFLSNHYHFILKQLIDNGIEIFMRKLGIGYSNYFNYKHNRTGVLCERRFEAYPIFNDNKLAWLSAYANCNYEIHKLGKVEDWQFSSYLDYLDLRSGRLANKSVILNMFKNIQSYQKYCQTVIKQAQDKKQAIKMLQVDEIL